MNDVIDIPREKLAELISKHGDALWQDRDRCEGLLRDHCGTYRREISSLTAALHERVPQELKSSWQTAMTPEAMRARLIQRLEDHCGLAPQVAAWAVETWAHALKVPLGRISDRVDSEVIAPASSAAAAAVSASGSVWIGLTNQPAGAQVNAAQANAMPVNQGSGSSPRAASVGLLSKPVARSSAGIVLVAACALGFFLLHQPKPGVHQQPSPPSASPVDGGSAPSPSPAPVDGGTAPTPTPAPVPAPIDGTSRHVPEPANTVPVGTPLRVRVNEELSSATATEGQYVGGTLLDPLVVNGKQIVAPGARAVLMVKTITAAGKISGRPELGLILYEIYMNNRPVRVSTNEHISKGPSRTVSTVKKAGIVGAAGCVVGGAVGKIFHHGGKGCAAGAGAGAAGGVAMSAASEAHPATIAAETILDFHLTRPLAIHGASAAAAKADSQS
jgi:hypothetical protein